MRAATREEFNKASEWRIYDYVTRHFIASLHDDMEYIEKTLLVDCNGYQFQYTWHEVCIPSLCKERPFSGFYNCVGGARVFTSNYGIVTSLALIRLRTTQNHVTGPGSVRNYTKTSGKIIILLFLRLVLLKFCFLFHIDRLWIRASHSLCHGK